MILSSGSSLAIDDISSGSITTNDDDVDNKSFGWSLVNDNYGDDMTFDLSLTLRG